MMINAAYIWSQNTFSLSIGHPDIHQEISRIVPLEEDSYLLVGNCTSDSENCVNILRIDALGNVVWHKYYTGLGVFFIRDFILLDKNDGFTLASHIQKENKGWDIGIVRFNVEGDTIWTRNYGGIEDDRASAIIQLEDKGYILTGSTWSFGNSDERDGYIIRTDEQGNKIWDKIITGSIDDRANAIVQETSNSFFLNISTENTPSGKFRPRLLRIDSQGNELWSRLYDTDEQHCGFFFKKSLLGGYIFNGCRDFDVTDNKNHYIESLMRSDSLGNFQWTTFFPTVTEKSIANFRELEDGSIVLVGISGYFTNNNEDFGHYAWMSKIDEDGAVLWERHYDLEGSVGAGAFSDLTLTDDGGFLVAGRIVIPVENGFQHQTWILKVDSKGCWQGNCSEDEVIITYPITTSIEASSDFNLLNAFHLYPNPSTLRSNITFHPSFLSGKRILRIQDVWGRFVREVVLEEGQQYLALEVTEWRVSDGIYVVSLEVNGNIIQQKCWVVVQD